MNQTENYRKYTSKNPIQKFLISNFLKTLFSCIAGLPIETILDAGCGEGFILSEFKKNNIGNYLEGIDFSEDALDICKNMFPSLTLKKGNIHSLPYADNSFDLVICTEVMEHLEEPIKVIDEIKRVSKRYCLFSVPNEPFFMVSNFLRGKNLSRWGNDIDHIQHWSSGAFEDFIKRNLSILTVKRPFPWTIILSQKEHDSF